MLKKRGPKPKEMRYISAKFKAAIRKYAEETPLYVLGGRINVDPSIISKVLNSRQKIVPNDERFKEVAKAIGYKGRLVDAAVSKSDQDKD